MTSTLYLLPFPPIHSLTPFLVPTKTAPYADLAPWAAPHTTNLALATIQLESKGHQTQKIREGVETESNLPIL